MKDVQNKVGLGFEEFIAWVDDLKIVELGNQETLIGSKVLLGDNLCRVQRDKINVGGKWQVVLVLYTSNPKEFINYELVR